MTRDNGREIVGLQFLRAVAALTVVAHHSLRAVTVNASPELHLTPSLLSGEGWVIEAGAGGVDVFFILSGFLMVYISGSYVQGRRPVSHFLQQRALRIWPMYALVTLFALKPALLDFLHTGNQAFDLKPDRLAGFLFLPSFNPQHLVQPIVGVGWTLSYEAMFYLCFALAIVAARKRLFEALVGILIVVFFAALLLPSTSVWHGFLSNTITLEFLYGAAIAKFMTFKFEGRALPLALIAMSTGVFLLSSFYGQIDTPLRPVTFGIAAALAFIGVLHLEGKVRWPRFIVVLGNASYSIYLVHILVIYQFVMPYVTRAIHKFNLQLDADVVALIALVAGVGAGLASYFLIERPLTKLLMNRPKPSALPHAAG